MNDPLTTPQWQSSPQLVTETIDLQKLGRAFLGIRIQIVLWEESRVSISTVLVWEILRYENHRILTNKNAPSSDHHNCRAIMTDFENVRLDVLEIWDHRFFQKYFAEVDLRVDSRGSELSHHDFSKDFGRILIDFPSRNNEVTAQIHMDIHEDPRQQSTKVEKCKIHDLSFRKHPKFWKSDR